MVECMPEHLRVILIIIVSRRALMSSVLQSLLSIIKLTSGKKMKEIKSFINSRSSQQTLDFLKSDGNCTPFTTCFDDVARKTV